MEMSTDDDDGDLQNGKAHLAILEGNVSIRHVVLYGVKIFRRMVGNGSELVGLCCASTIWRAALVLFGGENEVPVGIADCVLPSNSRPPDQICGVFFDAR